MATSVYSKKSTKDNKKSKDITIAPSKVTKRKPSGFKEPSKRSAYNHAAQAPVKTKGKDGKIQWNQKVPEQQEMKKTLRAHTTPLNMEPPAPDTRPRVQR